MSARWVTRVRLAEALEEVVAERNIGDQIAGQRIAHFLRRRAVGVGQDGILEADFLEHAKNVRPELDAGADFAEFRRLLEQRGQESPGARAHRRWPDRQCRRRRSERERRRHSYEPWVVPRFTQDR